MRVLPVGLLIGFTSLVLALPIPAADEPSRPPALDRLVARLGSASFAEREEASRALLAAGTAALDLLRKAVHSDDPETARRASELVAILEVRANSERLLTGRRLHLVYKDTPLKDALADFNKKAGVNLVLATELPQGVPSDVEATLARKGFRSGRQALNKPEAPKEKSAGEVLLEQTRITLDTGDVTFWEAYDQFCRAAGLADNALVPAPHAPAIVDDLAGSTIRFAPAGRRLMVRRALYADVNSFSTGHTGQFPLSFARLPPMPTCYAGPVRIRVHPPGVPIGGAQPIGERERLLGLEVTPEPGFAWQGILDVRVTRARDEQGRPVVQSQPYVSDTDLNNLFLSDVVIWDDAGGFLSAPERIPPWQVPLRLRLPSDKVKKLREVSGVIAARVELPNEPLLVQEDVLHAAGKTVSGQLGGSLKVYEVQRDKDGNVLVRVDLVPPQPEESVDALAAMAGAARVRMNVRLRLAMGGDLDPRVALRAEFKTLTLVDAAGKPFSPAEVKSAPTRPGEGTLLLFRRAPDQKEPARLVYHGPREVVVEVPFTLEDVPLP